MNKTIKRLFKAAGGAIEIDDVTQDEWTFTENLDVEKFARLIVEECQTPFNDEDAVTGLFIKQVLSERFGL